jgi:hypothetical protein
MIVLFKWVLILPTLSITFDGSDGHLRNGKDPESYFLVLLKLYDLCRVLGMTLVWTIVEEAAVTIG